MIRFFLLQNKQGKTRLSKWYATAPEDTERIKMEADIHRVIAMRVRGSTNFVEVQYLTYGPSVLCRIMTTPLMSFDVYD